MHIKKPKKQLKNRICKSKKEKWEEVKTDTKPKLLGPRLQAFNEQTRNEKLNRNYGREHHAQCYEDTIALLPVTDISESICITWGNEAAHSVYMKGKTH